MSTDLSFKEQFERRANTSVVDPPLLSSRVDLRIAFETEFAHPVRLAKILHANGLSLVEAHAVVSALGNHREVVTPVWPQDVNSMLRDLGALGLQIKAAVPVLARP